MSWRYDVAADVWSMCLRSEQRCGCEPGVHLLERALGGRDEEVRVRIGESVVELLVEQGRLTQITVQGASSVLQDDVLFDGARPDDEPF